MVTREGLVLARPFSAASVLAALLLLASCDLIAPPLFVMREGFEAGLQDWFKGSDVPQDPNSLKPVAWTIDLSQERVAAGNWSSYWFLDGRQDDGTIWLMRTLNVPKGRPLAVTLSLQLWSPAESFNTRAYVVAYASSVMPVEEAEFAHREPADKKTGWREYRFTIPVQRTAGEIWVACGISVAWETLLEYFIDDVRIEVR